MLLEATAWERSPSSVRSPVGGRGPAAGAGRRPRRVAGPVRSRRRPPPPQLRRAPPCRAHALRAYAHWTLGRRLWAVSKQLTGVRRLAPAGSSAGRMITLGGGQLGMVGEPTPASSQLDRRYNLVGRGQYRYPRHAPVWLAGLLRAGLLYLEELSTRAFALASRSQSSAPACIGPRGDLAPGPARALTIPVVRTFFSAAGAAAMEGSGHCRQIFGLLGPG